MSVHLGASQLSACHVSMLPPYGAQRDLPRSRLRESPRIYLLGTWVNRPQEGGRRMWGGVSVLRYSSSSGVEVRPSISLRCGWRPNRAITSRAALAWETPNSDSARRWDGAFCASSSAWRTLLS